MFCKECGKELPDNAKFCNYCGADQTIAEAGNQQVYQESVNSYKGINPKAAKKRKIAKVLFVLQAIAILGGISSGALLIMVAGGPAGWFSLLGYFLPAIIGVILMKQADKL